MLDLFPPTPRALELRERLERFMREVVLPGEAEYHAEVSGAADRWQVPAVMERMKAQARSAGLWNLFLPDSSLGAGLSNLEYAPLAELMGHSLIAPEVFN